MLNSAEWPNLTGYPSLTCSRGANYHLYNQPQSDPIGQLVISSPDLVLAVRGQIKGGGGRERRKRDLAKYESGPRVNSACSKSDLFLMCTVQSASAFENAVH